MRHARVFFESTGPDGLDPFFVDVMLDEKSRIVGKWLLLGLSGDIDNKNTWYPFVVRVDGVVDFGCDYEDRWYKTNLRDKTIEIGNTTTVWDEAEKEHVCRITKVVSLGKH